MMDTVMTRPRRFTLESGKRSSELLGLAQLHVAASLLSPRSAVSAGHLLQQPHVPVDNKHLGHHAPRLQEMLLLPPCSLLSAPGTLPGIAGQ